MDNSTINTPFRVDDYGDGDGTLVTLVLIYLRLNARDSMFD